MVLYAGLLSIIQMGYFEKTMNKLVIKMYGTSVVAGGTVSEEGDADVQREKAAVDSLANSTPGE